MVMRRVLLFYAVVCLVSYFEFRYVELNIRKNYFEEFTSSYSFSWTGFLLSNIGLKIIVLYPLKFAILLFFLAIGKSFENLKVNIRECLGYLALAEIMLFIPNILKVIWYTMTNNFTTSSYLWYDLSLLSFFNNFQTSPFSLVLSFFGIPTILFTMQFVYLVAENQDLNFRTALIYTLKYNLLPWFLLTLLASMFLFILKPN